jgi:hypothetical protein
MVLHQCIYKLANKFCSFPCLVVVSNSENRNFSLMCHLLHT